MMNPQRHWPSERDMKRLISMAVFSVVGVLVIAATSFALDPGARAPEIGQRDLAGNQVTMAGLRGRVVIVDFMASWCAPCADSMPVYQRLYEQYRDRGLTIVAVAQDNRAEDARRFAQRHRLTFPVVFDEGHAIARRYEPSRMPTAFIVDRAGIVRHVHRGYTAREAQLIENEVRALLDQR